MGWNLPIMGRQRSSIAAPETARSKVSRWQQVIADDGHLAEMHTWLSSV